MILAGTITEICAQLKVMRELFGGDMPLADILRCVRRARLDYAVKKQLAEI